MVGSLILRNDRLMTGEWVLRQAKSYMCGRVEKQIKRGIVTCSNSSYNFPVGGLVKIVRLIRTLVRYLFGLFAQRQDECFRRPTTIMGPIGIVLGHGSNTICQVYDIMGSITRMRNTIIRQSHRLFGGVRFTIMVASVFRFYRLPGVVLWGRGGSDPVRFYPPSREVRGSLACGGALWCNVFCLSVGVGRVMGWYQG